MQMRCGLFTTIILTQVSCCSSPAGKCRKRWARLQQKYQQTLSSAAQGLRDAASFCFPEGEGCDIADVVDVDVVEVEGEGVGVDGVDGAVGGVGKECDVQIERPHERRGSDACVDMIAGDDNDDCYDEMDDIGGSLDLDM